jgi:hypothetical protein
MTDWRTVLREVDRRNGDEQLSADDAESLRRAMLAAAANTTPERDHRSWVRPLLVAATMVAVVAVGILAGRRFDMPAAPENRTAQREPGVESTPTPVNEPNRQLQFLTPGGTRIIWVFNSDFDLKATVR